MSESLLFYLGLISGLLSLVSFALSLASIPIMRRVIYLIISTFLVGFPVTFFLMADNKYLAVFFGLIFLISICFLFFELGRHLQIHRKMVPDLLHITNNRPNAFEWVREELKNAKSPIEIDAFGVKLDALYKIVNGTGASSELPLEKECKLRVLILKSESFGVKTRIALEKHNRIEHDVRLMNETWLNVEHKHRKHRQHHINVRMFQFTPSMYIIRINNTMLVGTYLAETGYDNLTFTLQNGDGRTFGQFTRYFETIWRYYSEMS